MDAAYQAFLNNLAVYEFNMGKIQVVADTSARDAQAYGEQQVQLKAEMERTEVQADCPRRPSAVAGSLRAGRGQADIAKLKDQVAHERVVRKNKEEYAALASQVWRPPAGALPRRLRPQPCALAADRRRCEQVEALPPRTKTERDKEAQQQQIARLEEQNAAQCCPALPPRPPAGVAPSGRQREAGCRGRAGNRRWSCARSR